MLYSMSIPKIPEFSVWGLGLGFLKAGSCVCSWLVRRVFLGSLNLGYSFQMLSQAMSMNPAKIIHGMWEEFP